MCIALNSNGKKRCFCGKSRMIQESVFVKSMSIERNTMNI